MKIAMAFLADEANVSQEGKLNVLGVFDRIVANAFPVVHPRLVFAFRVHMEYADSGRTFPVHVRVVDEDGQPLFDATGELSAPTVAPGDFFTANRVFALVGLQFPTPGTYRFEISVPGQPPHETPFVLSTPSQEAVN